MGFFLSSQSPRHWDYIYWRMKSTYCTNLIYFKLQHRFNRLKARLVRSFKNIQRRTHIKINIAVTDINIISLSLLELRTHANWDTKLFHNILIICIILFWFFFFFVFFFASSLFIHSSVTSVISTLHRFGIKLNI